MAKKKAGVGRMHKDRFYSHDELPKKEQKFHDWAGPDEQFVRAIASNGRVEWVALENFTRTKVSPNGLPCDGFASDSYFSGHAIRLLHGRDDNDYIVWAEHV